MDYSLEKALGLLAESGASTPFGELSYYHQKSYGTGSAQQRGLSRAQPLA